MVLCVVVVIDDAESPIISIEFGPAESVPIDAESVPMMDVVMVESDVDVSSVLGFGWQAAHVSVVPMNRSAKNFLIAFLWGCLEFIPKRLAVSLPSRWDDAQPNDHKRPYSGT